MVENNYNFKEISMNNTKKWILEYLDKDSNSNYHIHIDDNGKIWFEQVQIQKLLNIKKQSLSQNIKTRIKNKEIDPQTEIKYINVFDVELNRNYKRKCISFSAFCKVCYASTTEKAKEIVEHFNTIQEEIVTKGFYLEKAILKSSPESMLLLQKETLELRLKEMSGYKDTRDLIKRVYFEYGLDENTGKLFARVQDLMYFAITGMCSHRLVLTRLNYQPDNNFGVTVPLHWITSYKKLIIAKNLLTSEELELLSYLTQMLSGRLLLKVKRSGKLTYDQIISLVIDTIKTAECPVMDKSFKFAKKINELAESVYKEIEKLNLK